MDDTAIPEPLAQESAAPRSRSPYTIAVALIAINVRVFLAMVASGVSFTQPTPFGVFKWVSMQRLCPGRAYSPNGMFWTAYSSKTYFVGRDQRS